MTHCMHGRAQIIANMWNRGVQVWKKGARLRVDGSLMGVEDEGPSLIPRWKRGHFSLLFDGATQVPAHAVLWLSMRTSCNSLL